VVARFIFVLIGHQYLMNLSFSERRLSILRDSIRKKVRANITYDMIMSTGDLKMPLSKDRISDNTIIAIER